MYNKYSIQHAKHDKKQHDKNLPNNIHGRWIKIKQIKSNIIMYKGADFMNNDEAIAKSENLTYFCLATKMLGNY